MLTKIRSIISSKTGILLALAAVAFLVFPGVKNRVVADDHGSVECPVLSTHPTISHLYPVSTTSPRPECTDRPLIAAYVNGQYFSNISANAGDEIRILSYIHNGAADGNGAAKDVNVQISVNTAAGSSHQITAQATSANAGSVGPESMTITTDSGSTLEIVPGSAHIEDFYGSPVSEGSVQTGSNSVSAHFNELKACFAYSKFIVFKVKVVAKTVPTLSCSVNNSNPFVNEQVTFTATGGEGSYSWTGGGTPSTGTGTHFTTAYSTIGTKTATVTSGNQTANCGVNVKEHEEEKYEFNLSVSPYEVCVGAKSLYTITNATTNLRGKQIFWSSTRNGVSTGEVLSGYGQYVGSDGTWSDYSSIWTESMVGDWVKTASFVDSEGHILASRSVSFKVKKCEVPEILSCSVNNSNPFVNEQVTFTATGGEGSYSWTGGGTPSTGTGTHFTTAYSTIGTKTVTVKSNGQTAYCSVKVREHEEEKGILEISKEVRNITQGGDYSTVANALSGDTVEYRIKVWAGSNVILKNVKVTDAFASGLDYIDGSLKMDEVSHAPGLSSGGIYISSLGKTPVVIKYRAIVRATSGSVVNTARATADNSQNSPSAQAVVNITHVEPGQPALTITKLVKNETTGTGYASSVNAKKNDIVAYKITVTNSGEEDAKDVFVSDSNSQGSASISNLDISKDHSGNLSGGISLGTLNPGDTVTITYKLTVNLESGTIYNTASVSASNASTKSASATVNVRKEEVPPGNTTININDSYNNTCVNNSCNTYYINIFGSTTPASELRQLSVQKNVRNVSDGYGAFSNSVSADTDDVVEFEVVVTNTGNQTVNDVRLTDTWNGGLTYVSGSTRLDNGYTGEIWNNYGLSLGSLNAGQQKRVIFQARVTGASGSSIQNIASVTASGVSSVQDDAWVFVRGVQGGNVSLVYSKKAYNDSKGADATSVIASKEDYITYTLTVYNSGNTPASNFVVTDDLSQVLPYADIVDNGGGTVTGNVITYPGISIPAGGSVSRSFKVRVKYFLSNDLSYVMTNTYGNTVTVRINTPRVLGAYVAPRTGADTGVLLFSSLMTAGFAIIRKGKYLAKLIFT